MLLLGHTDAERKQRLDIRGCERGAREWERAEPEVRRVSHLAAKWGSKVDRASFVFSLHTLLRLEIKKETTGCLRDRCIKKQGRWTLACLIHTFESLVWPDNAELRFNKLERTVNYCRVKTQPSTPNKPTIVENYLNKVLFICISALAWVIKLHNSNNEFRKIKFFKLIDIVSPKTVYSLD